MDPFAKGQPVNDSTIPAIKLMIDRAGAARAVVLEARRWWSTRLFLLASLLGSLTAVRQVVFCDEERRFLGMASPTAIVDGLAAEFPFLDAFARGLRVTPASSDVEVETDRQTTAWTAFVKAQLPKSKQSPGDAMEYERKVKVGVRAPLLAAWLGERWVDRCIRGEGGDLSMAQVQQIVDSLLPDVPVERRRAASGEEDGFQLLVVDRDAFALELAREWVRSGLPRSPVR
jgi:hypothetical protein